MKTNKSISLFTVSITTLFLICGCEDFIELEAPRTETVRETVFSTDETATAAMNGVYTSFLPYLSLFGGTLEPSAGLLSDEFLTSTQVLVFPEMFLNAVQPNNTTLASTFWSGPYNALYNTNSVIEGVTESVDLTADVRDQLRGEALFMRAFLHFYLVNLFGPIPYVDSTDIERNTNLSRTHPSQVYQGIIEDLREAGDLMYRDFDFTDGDRVRANAFAAYALLARSYLYTEDWSNAESSATSVIDQSDLFTLDPLENVFLATSQESILQLASIGLFFNENISPLGDMFTITSTPGSDGLDGFSWLRPESLAVFRSTSDLRINNWLGVFDPSGDSLVFPSKYKNRRFTEVNPKENTVLLRLAEQYLIRAEARARLSNLAGAIADVDVIRARAGVTLIADSIPTILQDDLISLIWEERQRELFAEGGHRWFDLKRTGRADEILSVVKGEDWQPTDVLLPIPESEIGRNANLLPQTAGY